MWIIPVGSGAKLIPINAKVLGILGGDPKEKQHPTIPVPVLMGFFFQAAVLPLLPDLSACFPRLPRAALAEELCSFGEGLKECRTPREAPAPRDIWLELWKRQKNKNLGCLDKKSLGLDDL